MSGAVVINHNKLKLFVIVCMMVVIEKFLKLGNSRPLFSFIFVILIQLTGNVQHQFRR